MQHRHAGPDQQEAHPLVMPASNFLLDDGIMVWFDGPEWDDVAKIAFEDAAKEIKNAAQSNAIWEDQTGQAREGLDTSVELLNGEVVLTLYHTVDYGLWLEVIQNGRFGIIMKTLEIQAPKAFRTAEARIASARSGRG